MTGRKDVKSWSPLTMALRDVNGTRNLAVNLQSRHLTTREEALNIEIEPLLDTG